MKLQIDNFDGKGPCDYTFAVDASRPPEVVRKLNQPSELRLSLLADSPDFVVPAQGARVLVGRTNGQDVFTGYILQTPVFEYLGWGERGPAYRYNVIARSDEALLDEKRLPDRCPFVDRSAGDALRQAIESLVPGVFDSSAVQAVDTIASYASQPQKKWSELAADLALEARGSYRTDNGAFMFTPVGSATYALNETDRNFCPEGLLLSSPTGIINDVTVVGEVEPQAYVKDYFIGDGLTTRFYLSQTPFGKTGKTLFDEEYETIPNEILDPTRWSITDPTGAVSVSAGKLVIAGGTGVDSGTTVTFVEQVEMGGALLLQHGDFLFGSPSSGVLGGLYTGTISEAGCLAGFQVSPNSGVSNIQALVKGSATGPVVNTVAGIIT